MTDDQEKRRASVEERKQLLRSTLRRMTPAQREEVARDAAGLLEMNAEAAALEREAAKHLPDAQRPSDRWTLGGILGVLSGKMRGATQLLAQAAYEEGARQARALGEKRREEKPDDE